MSLAGRTTGTTKPLGCGMSCRAGQMESRGFIPPMILLREESHASYRIRPLIGSNSGPATIARLAASQVSRLTLTLQCMIIGEEFGC